MKYQKTFKAFVFVCLCCMATILFAQSRKAMRPF